MEGLATEGLVFTLINNGTEYEISGYDGTDIEVYIPSTYNEKPVTSIGENAFFHCSSLTSVTIGNSVTEIGSSAFYNCSSLTTIYCEAKSKPGAWNDGWNEKDLNGNYHNVVWGYDSAKQ